MDRNGLKPELCTDPSNSEDMKSYMDAEVSNVNIDRSWTSFFSHSINDFLGVCNSHEQLLLMLNKFQECTCTSFSVRSSRAHFGKTFDEIRESLVKENTKPQCSSKNDPFGSFDMDVPRFFVSSKILVCKFGPCYFQKNYKPAGPPRTSNKVGCKAEISIRQFVLFPDFKRTHASENISYRSIQADRKWKNDLLKNILLEGHEVCARMVYYCKLPELNQHSGHYIGNEGDDCYSDDAKVPPPPENLPLKRELQTIAHKIVEAANIPMKDNGDLTEVINKARSLLHCIKKQQVRPKKKGKIRLRKIQKSSKMKLCPPREYLTTNGSDGVTTLTSL